MEIHDLGLSDEQIAWVNRASTAAVDPAEIVGRAVRGAFNRWRQQNPDDLRYANLWDRAGDEARRVAAALLAREAEKPGYIERLAVLPREKQTRRIRAEVYRETSTAYVWTNDRLYMVMVKATDLSEAVGHLPKVERTGSRPQWWRRRLRLWWLRTVANID